MVPKISCQIVVASSITAATRIHKYSSGISSIHAWINIISVATYHHFYFDSYCTSFSILISSSSSSITKQGMCESHNKLHARFAFFKSHEYRHKKTSFLSINTKLFFTCDDYSNGKYLSIRSNLFLSKVQNCEKAIEYEKISHCFFLNYLVTSKQSGKFFQKNCGLLRISKL